MKKILISQRVEIVKRYDEKRDCLDERWTDFVIECGFLPVLLPNNISAVKGIVFEDDFTGIILTGGNNLVKYGGDAPERDAVERYLIDFAARCGRPLLGVCRGMQIIQDYYGVGLIKTEGHAGVTHKVFFNGESKVKNSYHTLGANASADGLEIVAKAGDGIVEAVRRRDNKIYGVMWHPERNSPFEKEDIGLMRRIFGD